MCTIGVASARSRRNTLGARPGTPRRLRYRGNVGAGTEREQPQEQAMGCPTGGAGRQVTVDEVGAREVTGRFERQRRQHDEWLSGPLGDRCGPREREDPGDDDVGAGGRFDQRLVEPVAFGRLLLGEAAEKRRRAAVRQELPTLVRRQERLRVDRDRYRLEPAGARPSRRG